MSNIKDKNEVFVCPKTGRIIEAKKPIRKLWLWLIPIVGFLSLLWYLIRVIPKPQRATYPCQKVAAPIAWNFLGGSAIFISLTAFLGKMKIKIKSKPIAFVAFIITVIGLIISINIPFDKVKSAVADSATPNVPIGVARGVFPGRVTWVYNPAATSWDGKNGVSWTENNTSQTAVNKMISQSVTGITGKSNDKDSWESIFKYFNKIHGNGDVGYMKGEKIAIKLNLNNSTTHLASSKGNISSPQVIYSLLNQLVTVSGVEPSDITVFDASRAVPDFIYNKCNSGILKGIVFADFMGGDGRVVAERDTNTQIKWSYNVKGKSTYLPKCVTEAKYIINLASLKGHNLAGVTLCAKNHFGTICSDDKDGNPTMYPPQAANIHGTIAAADFGWGDPAWTFKKTPMESYSALVDLMGHKDLGQKTLLFIIEALYPQKDQTSDINVNSKWKMVPFENDWASSIFTSLDGVAIDSVGYDFLSSEPTVVSKSVLPSGNSATNYLHEAALADNPASGTFYDPEGDGVRLPSLGVHEHWNNATDKKYSRNLGTGNGIELIQLGDKVPAPTLEPKVSQLPIQKVICEKVSVIKFTSFENITVRNSSGKIQTIRLLGISAPKDTTTLKAANAFAKAKLTGKTIYIEKDVTNIESNNKLPRYIWLKSLNTATEKDIQTSQLSGMLLVNGYADLSLKAPNTKYKAAFERMLQIAKDVKR